MSNSCKRKFEKTSSPSRFVKVELIFEQSKLRHCEVTKYEENIPCRFDVYSVMSNLIFLCVWPSLSNFPSMFFVGALK